MSILRYVELSTESLSVNIFSSDDILLETVPNMGRDISRLNTSAAAQRPIISFKMPRISPPFLGLKRNMKRKPSTHMRSAFRLPLPATVSIGSSDTK